MELKDSLFANCGKGEGEVATIEFRTMSADQKELVLSKIDEVLGKGVGQSITIDMEIVIATGKRAEVFLVPQMVLEVFTETQGKRNPYCLGIYIGDLVHGEFLLGIEGATLCSPYTTRKVKVSDKGEQTVLYGRDIRRSQIRGFPPIIRKGEKVLVINALDETIAIGKALVDGEEFSVLPKENVAVKNILDRGWYLRKGT
jgi:ribosome biogenesis protein Nip4